MAEATDSLSTQTDVGAAAYRLVYFNSRGAAEPIRLLLVLSGAAWEDVRYPLGAAALGFSLDHQYIRDREDGSFAANMGSLPILSVREANGATYTLGQSHTISRFLATRHSLTGSTQLEVAAVDCICKCVRDVKQRWFSV